MVRWLFSTILALLTGGIYALILLMEFDIRKSAVNRPEVLETTQEWVAYLASLPEWLTYIGYAVAAIGVMGALTLLFRRPAAKMFLMFAAGAYAIRHGIELYLFKWPTFGQDTLTPNLFAGIIVGFILFGIAIIARWLVYGRTR